MDDALKGQIAESLNILGRDIVTWDRCVVDPGGLTIVYGWIERDDGRADFVVLQAWHDEDNKRVETFFTSSALYTRDLARNYRGTDEGHIDCERVEDVFGDLVARKTEAARK